MNNLVAFDVSLELTLVKLIRIKAKKKNLLMHLYSLFFKFQSLWVDQGVGKKVSGM